MSDDIFVAPPPVRKHALLGRDTLLAELAAHLADQPLLTLIGPGGVGKTSIARELAALLAADTAEVRWVDLAGLTDGAALPQTVAAACSLIEQPGQSWTATVIGALQSASSLLILDNCEHLRAACAELCTQLLAACPNLHVLATSRESLGLAHEMRIVIPPLDGDAAVALFCRHAMLRLPSFDQQAAPAVAAICAQLDRLPLAIELAASRVTVLRVGQIAERVAHSLSLLASRDTARPLRQRSLRATLDWSYALLNADEQALFCQLAVFAGGFDIDAVEAVGSVPAPLDTLAELVDASLVGVTARGDVSRYRLHEVVRQYAAERLEERGERQAAEERQRTWAVALAERAELGFDVAHQSDWIAQLALERENLRRALQTAEEMGDASSVLRIAGALGQFWNSVSISEGRDWLARGRACAPIPPSIVSAKAWNCESLLAYRQGDYEGMYAAATAALAAAGKAEYLPGVAAARYRLGIYAEMKGATAEAREQYSQSFELFQQLGDQRGMSQNQNGLAHVAKFVGDFPEARRCYREGLRLARAIGDQLTTALLLISLANLMLDSGDFDGAEAAYAESLAHLRAANNTSYLLYALNGLGEVARYRNDFARANDYYREGLAMSRSLGLKDMEAQFLGHLGRTATSSGEYLAAAQHLSAALRIYMPLGRTARTVGTMHSCADLVCCLGYPAQATTLFVAGLRAIGAEDFGYLGHESAGMLAQSRAAAQAALPPAEYALAVADGSALSLDHAAELALSAVFLPQRPHQAAPVPELQIFLFGQLRVQRSEGDVTSDDWVYSKTRDLLVFLLLVDSADKGEIGAALWPDASASQLRQNFRVAIYHLRRALGRAEWITFRGGRYAFNRALPAWVDLDAFEQATAQASSDPSRRLTHLRIAAALYTGDLALGELDSDLALIRRERLHQQAIEVLLELGDAHLSNRQYAAAAAAYRQVLALDSYAEAAERGLLHSLARQGEHATALAHYQQFVALLDHDLGVAPTPETVALAAQIQAGRVI